MDAAFDVNRYWLERGRTYIEEKRTPAEFHRLQERFLVDVLQRSGLPMNRILEIGCGFGRITRLLGESWPTADITALDLSPDQLSHAARYCGDNPRLHFEPYDFYSTQPLPAGAYDLVVAVEVFLHHPPEFIVALLRRLAAAGRYLVNIDWSEDWPWSTPEHVWVHDFARLYASAGLRFAALLLPEKVDGKQQKLFIAGPDLPITVCQLQDTLPVETASRAPAQGPDNWAQQVSLAANELLQIIPSGNAFVLVDDGHWGNLRALSGYRVNRLVEKDGDYWGPPADDETAWQEVSKLLLTQPSHLVFAWSSFWWKKCYRAFYRRVRDNFACVRENERIIVFDLRTPPRQQAVNPLRARTKLPTEPPESRVDC